MFEEELVLLCALTLRLRRDLIPVKRLLNILYALDPRRLLDLLFELGLAVNLQRGHVVQAVEPLHCEGDLARVLLFQAGEVPILSQCAALKGFHDFDIVLYLMIFKIRIDHFLFRGLAFLLDCVLVDP